MGLACFSCMCLVVRQEHDEKRGGSCVKSNLRSRQGQIKKGLQERFADYSLSVVGGHWKILSETVTYQFG